MELYLEEKSNPVYWPGQIETVYQSLCGGVGGSLTPKLPHLTDSDALFLGALVGMPRANRPHGIITWASEAFHVSRKSIYALGERIEKRLFGDAQASAEIEAKSSLSGSEMRNGDKAIVVTDERLRRTLLRATFPGNVSIRPTQEILQEALDETKSTGYISELRKEAGLKARQVLRNLDYSGVGSVIVGRDETFYLGPPILTVIEPVSSMILFAEVCGDRKAETWGTVLEIVEDQGITIKGLIEDMARNYEKSQELAALSDVEVQKDPWHLLRDSTLLLTTLEKNAYRAIQRVIDLEKQLNKKWSDKEFETYIKAVAAEPKAIEQYDAYTPLHAHFCDALEMVDWRSGEIRDPLTAEWLLDAVLEQMALCTDIRILKFLKKIRTHKKQLLTFLDWLHKHLPQWRADLWTHLRKRDDVLAFERIAAQHWWCQQRLIAGQRQWQSFAQDVQLILENWTDHSPVLHSLASRLMRLFDESGHTNSVTESINGLLKSFFNSRQGFQSTETMQAYLDLFVLWHNTRVFDRGKRQGKSPFQIAGVDTDSDDWITLIGY